MNVAYSFKTLERYLLNLKTLRLLIYSAKLIEKRNFFKAFQNFCLLDSRLVKRKEKGLL